MLRAEVATLTFLNAKWNVLRAAIVEAQRVYVVYFLVETPMTRRNALGAIVLSLAGIIAAAQSGLNGKWEGETRNGTAIVLTLVVKDAALTGTLARGEETAPLAEGKVLKNTFTFKATIGGQVEGFSGELAGAELKIWLDRQGAERAIVLHRAKE